MAGATADVLLPNSLSGAQRLELDQFIQLVSSGIDGRSFWIAGQPFLWCEDCPDKEQKNIVVTGWSPKSVISFSAMCRGCVSDTFLAMLAAKVAEMFGGVIAFGGHINSFASDAFILTLDGRFQFEDEDVLTPQFLYQWLAHPNFTMVN